MKRKALGLLLGQMGTNMKEIECMIKSMVRELLDLKMEMSMQEIGRKTR